MKTEYRNKLDQENEAKLKQQVRQLQMILSQQKQQASQVRGPIFQEVVKEVIVERKIRDPVQTEEIKILRTENKQAKQKLAMIQQSYLIAQNECQKDQLKFAADLVALQNQLTYFRDLYKCKSAEVDKLKRQIVHLNERITIMSSKTATPIQPIILYQTEKQEPKIHTVYVEKPVQKTVFLEVQKKIKEFIQPERPIVNRIINCPPEKECECEKTRKSEENQESQHEKVYQKYEDLVKNFKQEREKLVSIIRDRDSDIKLFQQRVKLIQSEPKIKNDRGLSSVNVTVTREEDIQKKSQPIKQIPKSKTQKKLNRK